MAEAGENPGNDDNHSGINNKRQNADTSDEEGHGAQKQLVAAIQCTDNNSTLKNDQEAYNADEDPQIGGTLPFVAEEGTNGEDQERMKNKKMKILILNAGELCKLVHKKSEVTPEIRKLSHLIKTQAQEIGHLLDPGVRENVEILSRTVERMRSPTTVERVDPVQEP